MVKRHLIGTVLICSLALTGCSTFLASASGTAPVGVASSERSFAQIITDNGIVKTAEINLYKLDPRFKFSRVNIESFHSVVLLTGQVPDEHLKKLAEDNVKSMSDVKAVHNYISVGDKSEYNSIVQDGMLTATLRKNILLDKRVRDTKVKVVTEAAVVYVMGRLTPSETNAIMDVLQKTGGMTKIVSLIDSLPESGVPVVVATPAAKPEQALAAPEPATTVAIIPLSDATPAEIQPIEQPAAAASTDVAANSSTPAELTAQPLP